jgi:hypothetical protein
MFKTRSNTDTLSSSNIPDSILGVIVMYSFSIKAANGLSIIPIVVNTIVTLCRRKTSTIRAYLWLLYSSSSSES